MKVINVPQTLREVKNYKSVAEKVIFLSRIQKHPLHPYLMDSIVTIVDMACEDVIDDDTMIKYINEICEKFADKFNTTSQPVEIKIDPELPF